MRMSRVLYRVLMAMKWDHHNLENIFTTLADDEAKTSDPKTAEAFAHDLILTYQLEHMKMAGLDITSEANSTYLNPVRKDELQAEQQRGAPSERPPNSPIMQHRRAHSPSAAQPSPAPRRSSALARSAAQDVERDADPDADPDEGNMY